RGVAVGIEKGGNLGSNLVGDRPQVGRGHSDVFGECSGAIDADADGMRTQVLFAGATIAADAADDVTFRRNALADFVAAHAGADLHDATDEFVADHEARLDRALGPVVP